MEMNERDVHDVLTHLTSILVGLEILQARTELSPRQAAVVDHALRSTHAMRDAIVNRIARQIGWEGAAPPPLLERRAHPRWAEPPQSSRQHRNRS